jgi:shikimate kinase/3-dehydroquinate synthase
MRRPLLLNGFMATGKSTVGRLVAEWCGRPFVDLDAEIERHAGQSVADLFATQGEPAFRALEREALARILDAGEAKVVALGGGALLRRHTRLDAIDRAVVVNLDATAEDIAKRALSPGAPVRPLLTGADPLARIEQLLDDRKLAYSECHARVSTSGRTPDDVARAVLAIWQRDPLGVAAGNDSYSVEVGRRIAVERLPALLAGASLGLLVTDRNVHQHHGDATENGMEQSGVRTATVVLEPGEEHKHVGSLERIWGAALAAGADRKSRFVALGGGVVTDVAGFAAATWMRGVRWVGIPTTLLAMVDASVGGKTAIDLKTAKNAIGAFCQPMHVLCDVEHLATEPARGYVSALAEVVKTAIIGDPDLLTFVEQHAAGVRARDLELAAEIVRRSIRVKARVVSLDEREDGIRAWLNLGHTVGHALEAYGGYGKLRHGEAISLGLVAALKIGERLGITERALTERCILAQRVLGLPVDLASQPLARASELIGHDKKRAGGRLKFVAARRVGQVELVDLTLDELRGHVAALAG